LDLLVLKAIQEKKVIRETREMKVQGDKQD
jgi:hypothetical protein